MGSSGGWGVEGWAVQLKFVGSGREIPWGWSFNKEVRERWNRAEKTCSGIKPAEVSTETHVVTPAHRKN